jgi:hypothetical protein
MEPSTCQHHLGCEDVEPLLPLAADGAIDAASDPAVFAHLARCNDCQESLVRHDLITLGLECGRSQVQVIRPASWHYRLPWPAAAAALVGVAVLSSWLAQRSPAVMQPLADNSSQRTDTLVFKVPGPNPSRPYYKVVQGDRVSLIDPQAVDGAVTRDTSDSHQVLRKVDSP